MKKVSQILKLLFTVSIAAVIFSCNGNGNETAKDESAEKKDTTAAIEQAPVPAFTPFDVVEITHTVKDYIKWRPAFNTDSTARKASGLEDMVIGRGVDNPNSLNVVLKVSDVQKAKDFAANPRLKEVMEKNGVISKPVVEFFHVITFNPDSKEKQWVLITHKVKDFDAWLKVYDAEGIEARASYGLVDVALARGIDDPSVVHIVFDIKDMAKATARMSDPALKN
ncbi:MAG: hypothetical protein IPP72_15690 [Chitinophagaceae bacterium]|nr:hypothetical protein [Chitinophagaceae bacterium]